ncbi:MAG: rane fusion protein multidrug efflux system [Candidatus Sumerlaeota bacterium]|nr:rane fusion protein multidrug efflux system [Candidatus Sumerlaeota bacterium]
MRLCLRSLFLLLLLAPLAACKRPENNARNSKDEDKSTEVKEEKPFLTPVLVDEAERGEIRSTIATTGSIIPARSLAIRTEEPGRLFFEKPWKEGDFVEEGTVIARLDSPSLAREVLLNRADLDIQKENLDIAERSLRFREDEFQTVQNLYSRGISAKKELDATELELERARNSRKQAQINLEKARANLLESEARLERLVIKAPYSGILVAPATLEGTGRFTRGFGQEAVTSYEGKQVASGHLVCGLVDTTEVFMRCDITSKDIGRIRIGQQADATLYATEDYTLTGEVVRLSNSVNPDTRAFEVDIRLANETGTLKPGMFGRAEIVVERRRDTIRLPKSAITRRNNVDIVFVATPQNDTGYDVARMTAVELGLEGKDEVEVTFGVKEGDRVVVRGHEVLQDNTPVNALDVDAPALPAEEEEEATEPQAD